MTEGGRPGPPIGGHRLLSNGRSLALVTAAAEIDWWCAPDLDCPPLLWSLLDHRGAAARWIGARYASTTGRPAGPSARGIVVIDGRRVAYCDGLVDVDGTACLVRMVSSEGGELRLCHQLAVGGFGGPWGTPGPGGFQHEECAVGVVTEGESTVDSDWLSTTIVASPGRWGGLVITAGPAAVGFTEAVARLDADERAARQRLGRARLPRHHPERAADALAVLEACTYRPTGAVVASATTSLPEAPGADRQFDYRYCWLRDAALATSVASPLGQGDVARHHLKFLCYVAGSDPQLNVPVVDVRGDPVPEERAIEGIQGWAQSALCASETARLADCSTTPGAWSSKPSRSISRPAARSTTPPGPPLLSEEADPVDATALGNVPLVWSHMELARALYLLDAARLRHRYGTAALTAWRIARFASLRRRTRTTTTRRHHAATDKETDMGNDRDGRRSVRPRASRARASSIRPNHAGLGRRSTPEAEAVSDALRRGTDAFLTRRRRTAALCLTSIGSLGIVAAYQNGLIRRLPEPPLPGLDADRVDASGEAYQYLKTPDAALGIVSTAITLVLAGMGDANRSQSRRWIPLALAVKAVLDAAFGLFLTAEQATKHRKFCSFCLLAALTNLATVPQTWPEARAAWRNQK